MPQQSQSQKEYMKAGIAGGAAAAFACVAYITKDHTAALLAAGIAGYWIANSKHYLNKGRILEREEKRNARPPNPNAF